MNREELKSQLKYGAMWAGMVGVAWHLILTGDVLPGLIGIMGSTPFAWKMFPRH